MLKLPNENELSTLSLADPISSATEEKRRNLLFVSSISILLVVYDLKINKTPWLDIEVPAGAPDILRGVMSVALVYTLVTFIAYLWTDLQRWHFSRAIMNAKGMHDHLIKLHNLLNRVGHLINNPEHGDALQEITPTVVESQKHANEHLKKLVAEFQAMKRSHSTLNRIQVGRLLVIDIGVPLLLGLLATYKIIGALPAFVFAAFR